ncbi:conserved hypothetical protein [Peptoniphilus harei ACS-146-V-Sch2b]|uniref:Uncharacterized protein n=2 Tax=Peptoniphilus harei TaxID=54005 RepID=E4KX39_9FIRM|nr:conserved hypothetical protein [Peptoniphilus harei ACS-146-V-Sch2b]KXA28697.1 hypothetical protein HMPREF3229_01693 [Peptoniphilus harei]
MKINFKNFIKIFAHKKLRSSYEPEFYILQNISSYILALNFYF